MSLRLPSLLACLALLGFSGCAIYTPFEVKRGWVDWNSERHLNAQFEGFDHLPPKPLRVRLMRWGYNIGPAGASPLPATSSLVSGAWTGRVLTAPATNWPRALENELPPPANPAPLQGMPGEPMPFVPPAPPAELYEPGGEQGPQGPPSASRGPTLKTAGYQSAATTRSTNARRVRSPSSSAWLFNSGSRSAQ